jgi:hypothetical protein
MAPFIRNAETHEVGMRARRPADGARPPRHFLTGLRALPSRLGVTSAIFLLLGIWSPCPVKAQELKFPQIITIKYEAKGSRAGGHFIIWVEREKIWYGLDPKIYPAARSVEVTHITPAPGSTTITMIAVTSVNSTMPDYFHLSGNVRFKISGMLVTSSNVPWL